VSGPASGRLLQLFALPTSRGGIARLSAYKQRNNLVVFWFHAGDCAACRALLRGLAESVNVYAQAEAVVLGVGSQPANVPALLITDRFAEIWAAWDGGALHALPTPADIGGWLEFVELQCRECEAPEWPLADAAQTSSAD
jgi:hypothetical protein